MYFSSIISRLVHKLCIEEKIHFQDITAGLTFHDNFHIHLKIEAYV